MRHPLWIVNSSLLLLLLIGLGFIFFTNNPLPRIKTSAKKTTSTKMYKKVEAVALSKIYENDLFDTIKQVLPEIKQPERVKDIPPTPQPKPADLPPDFEASLLPALNISVTGIMIINNEDFNVAMIKDNTTNKEKNYKVGDMLQDAQIVKIMPNRVVLVRSNGQHESLFLTAKNEELLPLNAAEKREWKNIVRQKDNSTYLLDPKNMSGVIPHLSMLINLLQLTNVFKDGISIGCRITANESVTKLITALGFQQYDIITSINTLPVGTYDERVAAFNILSKLDYETKIKVEFLRKKTKMSHEYILTNLETSSLVGQLKQQKKDSATEIQKTGILEGPTQEELEEQRIAMLKEKYQFAPTMQEILLQQKKAMLHEGQTKRIQDYSFPSEM